MARRARGSLRAEEILDAAWALVLDGGLDALTMPALARRLEAGVTSIYWYFRTKDDLLLALAERATGELLSKLPPLGDERWDVELHRHFSAFRAELNRTPLYLELFSLDPRSVLARPSIAPIVAQRLELEIGLFVAQGIVPNDALRLYAAVWTFMHGFVLLELGVRRELASNSDVESVIDAAAGAIDPAELSVLAEPGVLAAVLGHDGDRDFEAGLQAILLGLGAQVARASRAPRPVRRPLSRNRS